MEGPGDYSSMDRPRILTSGGRSSDNLATSGFTEVSGGGVGAHTPSVNEISGRASTPTTLTTLAAQYHSRYLPSAMPGSNFALMNSFLTTGAPPSAESRKSLLPDLQHYWSVHAESFPRYLMTRGLYPPYPPLFSAAPESLSLLGPGVACVPGSAGNTGPSSSMSGSHYQRFIEMQNEAFLATVTASASHHHQALYGLGPNSIQPSFLEQPSSSSHASTPLSLVKQEPKEISCSEKAAKQSERRSSSFKLDLDHAVTPVRSRDGHFISTPRQDGSSGAAGGGGYREQKAVVTSLMCSISSSKPVDKRSTGYGANTSGAGGSTSNGNDTNNDGHVKKTTYPSSSSLEPGPRRYQTQVPRKNSSPAPNKDFLTRTSNPHVHVIPPKKPSPRSSSNPKHPRAPTSATSSPLHSKELSASASPDPSVIISIPTSISAPIPLASVQHDGVLLAALASPSSAAASSAAATVKSVAPAKGGEKSVFSSGGRIPDQEESPKAWPDTDSTGHGANRSHLPGLSIADVREESERTSDMRTAMSAGNSRNSFGDESSDVVVDSTDDTESACPRVASSSKHDRDRAIAETIERVAAATSDNDDEYDDDEEDEDDEAVEGDANGVGYKAHGNTRPLIQTVSTSLSGDPKPSSFSSSRQEPTTSMSRTVMAKTQPVPLATTSAGNIPVGIAVAQIRPQHIHHYEGDSSPSASATEMRLPQNDQTEGSTCIAPPVNTSQSSVSGESTGPPLSATRPESDVNSIGPDPAPPLTGRLPPSGHVVNPSLWLQQLSFPIQAVNTAGAAYNPIRYPISAPSGFKFAHDSLTGQFFLIATGDGNRASYQSNLSTSSNPVEEHRRRDRQSSRPDIGQNLPSLQPMTDKVSSGRIISTLRKDGTKQQAMAQPFTTSNVNNSNSNNNSNNSNSSKTHLPPTASSSSSSSLSPSSSSLTLHQHLLNAVNLAYHPVKNEKKPTQSRGCSPIIFDSNGKFLPSQSLSANFKPPETCSVSIQTCDFLLDFSAKDSSSERARLPSLHPKRRHASSDPEPTHSVPTLNPLSVHCPDIDPMPESGKARSERLGYNPFTDPQILQAADGLELLSTLAEKRPKCSSYDDPKRIFPSPSDSFKSDTASVLAPEDTLSPADGEMKSGQCTPRRDVRRDLSPKWSLPKKEPSTSSSFCDFKTPTGLELMDPVEVRERLAEVQRRYKQKQKELAKLDSKKPDDAKACKRGPGRPPKKKALVTRKSDDDSSSSSSKAKEGHQHKKKRPAEELVDRVFRKLPPVKPAKASRSIHYVKSKTGPFFKRKPASSSSKRNKDLFGLDDKNWLGLQEGKHKKKYGEEKKSKSKKKDTASKVTESLHWKIEKSTDESKTAVFTVESSKPPENTERRGRPPKAQGTRNGKESVKSVAIVTVKSEPSVIQSDPSLGRLHKLSFTSQQSSVVPVSLSTSSLIISTSSNSATTNTSSSTTTVSNTTTTITKSSPAVSSSVSSLFPSTSSNVTFGSMSSILEGSELSLAISSSSSISTVLCSTTNLSSSSNINSKPLITTPSTSLITSQSSMPSLFSFEDSSFLNNDNTGQGNKRKGEEDSDTDTSDTSPNKKRKPGRPRKINPDKSAGGTETIWAKKSSSMSLLQIPDPGASHIKESDNKLKMEFNSSVMKPLFLDEEWCRRRSERIFLSEPSPQPSPSPRAEPVWKLSNFMPKNTKLALENSKENKDDKDLSDTESPFKDQEKSNEVSNQNQSKKSSVGDDQTPQQQSSVQDVSSSKGKKGARGKGKAAEKEQPKPVSRDETSTPSPTPSMKKARRAQEHTKMKHQKAKSLHDLTQKVKKKYSKGQNKKTAEEKKPVGKKDKKRKSGSDSSDTDNAPLSSFKDRPNTPEPRSAIIDLEDLKDGLKVLYLNDGLFYEGVVKAIQPPDVYGVLTAGQRGNRPHILCQEEILRDAVVDVKPGSIRYLSEGVRICAFWSQQFSCLYPGTIAKTSPNPHLHTSVNVEFDDGDSGRIPVDHVRLLPPDFPIIEYEPDPLENLPKRRKQTSNSKASGTDSKSSKKNKTDSSDEEEEKEKSEDESEDSDSSDDSDDGRMWKWAGKSTKRPGLKGRAKKEFYKSIMRGKESIMVGDSAVFVSTGRVNCPYIGRVESLWESWGGQKMVRVSWFYHPEETKGGKRLADTKNALFESAHGDENDVQTISHKCEVLSHAAYKRRLNEANRKGQSIGPNVFYLAGYYDPTVSLVKFEPGVL